MHVGIGAPIVAAADGETRRVAGGRLVMPLAKLVEFLEDNAVRYVRVTHSRAYTAQEVAQTAHVAGKEVAKTVMAKIDGRVAMVVLPATCKVDLELLKRASGANRVEIADEEAFRNLFPDCEVGAMPPFGNLFGMEVYVADALGEDEEIWFNAGSHTELIRVSYPDFERLVQPHIVECCARV
jgi:Ala-tRNA(Pro) deacylase